MRAILSGVVMSLMMMLVGCGGQALKTLTFTSSQSVTIPAGVSSLVTLTGNGQAGSPEQGETPSWTALVTKTSYFRNGTQAVSTQYEGPYDGSPGRDSFCEGVMSSGDPYQVETCYEYTQYGGTTPATTGASATMTGPNGFSRTFPGGTGGTASPVTYNNVAITPGSYALTIPAGGSITISYYE